MISNVGTPSVSIIMLAYNRDAFIAQAIDSILKQTYKNWQLIIINNGSVDNTSAIINCYTDSRITHVTFPQNRHTGIVRNYAIQRANTELIAFADDDDIWMTDKLEKQVHQLLQYPDAGFCYTNGYNFCDNSIENNFLSTTIGVGCDDIFESYCKGECGIFLQTVLVWRRNILKSGFFEENRTFADFKFIGNLTYHFKGVILYEPLLKRRIHQSNSINTYGKELNSEYVETLKFYRQNNMLSRPVFTDGLFKYYVDRITYANKASERLASVFNAISIKPFSIIPIKKLLKSIFRGLVVIHLSIFLFHRLIAFL